MAFIPSIVAVSFYFEKRRSIAIGIAVCGTGIGTFAIAPLRNALLSEYSWKGTTLIEAGILLNCIICGTVFRPLNIRSEMHQDVANVKETAALTKVVAAEESIKQAKSASCLESRHSSHDLERRRRSSESDNSISSRASSTLSTGTMLTSILSMLDTVFCASSVDHIPQYPAEPDECDGSTTSAKQEPEPQSDRCGLATISITNEQEEKSTNVVGSAEPRMNVMSAGNLEPPQTWAASSQDVQRKRRLSESENSAESRTPSRQLVGHVSHKNVFDTRSLDRIPQYQTERDDCVRSTSSQPQPHSDDSGLAKVGITNEKERKPSNVIECGQPIMKVKNTSNIELLLRSSVPSLHVERRRRHSESEKSTFRKEKPTVVVEFGQPGMTVSTAANAELLQTWAASSPNVARRRRHSEPAWSPTSPRQLAGTTAAHGNVVRTRSLSPQHRAERDDCVRSTTSPNEQREPRSDKSWLAKSYKTEEKEGTRTELIGADLPGTKMERAPNLELTLLPAASTREVERKRRFSDSDTSAVPRTSVADPTSHHHLIYGKSLDRIPQHRAECDQYDRCTLSTKEQPEPQKDACSWLAKIGTTDEEQTKPIEVDVPNMKDKIASNPDPTQTPAAPTAYVERRSGFTKLKKPATSHIYAQTARPAGFTSHKNVFRSRSLRRTLQDRAERHDYVGGTASPMVQPELQSDQSWLEAVGAAKEEERKPTNPISAELPTMKDKSASNPDLTQTSAASTPDVERRSRFIKVKKPTARPAGLASHKNVFRSRSLRRIPQHRAERDDYVGSMASLTVQPELQSDQSCRLETRGVIGEQKGEPTNALESAQPRMKFKSASALDLTQIYAANVTRRRHPSESEKSTKSIKSTKSTISRASFKHLADRMTQPELFYAISLEHIPPPYWVDSENDYGSVTSVEPQSDKSWLEMVGNTKKMRQRMSETMICRLFLDSVFVLFAVSTLLTSVGYVVPYVFLPNRGLSLGFDSNQSSWLISVVGISNTVGRFVFGFIASAKHVNSLMLYSTMLIICGMCSVLSVLLKTFPLQMCYALCFGFLGSKS